MHHKKLAGFCTGRTLAVGHYNIRERTSMTDRILEIIKLHSEGHALDFKKEQYPIDKHPKKHEILKDFMAMLNHPSDEEKYIICGIKEKNGVADQLFDIGDLIDEAKYQQLINNNIEPSVNFEYKQFNYEKKKLAYFRLFNNTKRPYLIKKEIRNASNSNSIEYYPGDGFIRVGTSTRRLTRDDYENIYRKKYINRDRKNDLIIRPYFKKSDNEKLVNLPLNCLEVSVENTSNKSIELEFEMKIFKLNGLKIFSEFDLLTFAQEQNQKKSNINPLLHFDPIMNNPLINITEQEDYYEVIGNKLILAQNDNEKDVFSQYVFIMQKEQKPIEVEIVVRSDDFTEGRMIKRFEMTNNE